jgi:hypothetical protein
MLPIIISDKINLFSVFLSLISFISLFIPILNLLAVCSLLLEAKKSLKSELKLLK